MQKRFSRLACMAILLLCCHVFAQNAAAFRGLYLLTDYPALTLQAGTTATLELRLRNYGITPARLTLSTQDIPAGWTATLLGSGQPVAAVMVGTDENVPLQLRLQIPSHASEQVHTLKILAHGEGEPLTLPLSITLAKVLPTKLTLEAHLPAIKGSARSSFDYAFTVKNDSGKDLTVNFDANTPQDFDPTFTDGYGSQPISALPIKAGQTKDVKLNVRPPSNAKPGTYPLTVTAMAGDVKATSALRLQITGQPLLRLSGRDDLMSSNAEAGKTTLLPIILNNDGGADADDIVLNASLPAGWNIEFDPKTISHLNAGQHVEIQAHIMPSFRSLAGDYIVSMNAEAGGQEAAGEFRVTVSTSSRWVIIGVLLVVISILIILGIVSKLGRR